MTILPLQLLYQVKVFVSWENGLKLCLPKTWTNEPRRMTQSSVSPRPKQMSWVFQCHSEMAFSRPCCHQNILINSKLCLQGEWLETLSPQDLNKWVETSPLSLRNSLFKTILPLKSMVSTWNSVSHSKDSKVHLPETWGNEPNLPHHV